MPSTAKNVVPPPVSLVVPESATIEVAKLYLASQERERESRERSEQRERESRERRTAAWVRGLMTLSGAVVVVAGVCLHLYGNEGATLSTVVVGGGFTLIGGAVGQQLVKGEGASSGGR